MNLFEFNECDKILFLGEGNFSFSCCLLKLMTEKIGTFSFSNLYVTCFQNDLSSVAILNVNFLKSQGAEVLLGVDATKLKDDPILKFIKFNKIIFNFPHVGGKMKIHLNRALLCNFFVSCSDMLTSDGKVLVTLCSGQGGTKFEKSLRRWDDTWQIVEQAAHGSFVLTHIDYFPHLMFSDYQPVGYRGREQKFSISSSVLHVFHKVSPVSIHINNDIINDISRYHTFQSNGDLTVLYAYKMCLLKSPLENQKSLQHYVTKRLHEVVSRYDKNAKINFNLPYHVEYDLEKAPCFFKGALHSLRSCLLDVMPKFEGVFVTEGLVFQKLGFDFSTLGATCQAIVGGTCKYLLINEFFDYITKIFNFDGDITYVNKEHEWCAYIQSKTLQKIVAYNDLHSNYIIVDIDCLCLFLFKVCMKELWAAETTFDGKSFKLILPSLYPLEFRFDISFSSDNDLDEDEFFSLLHQAPDNLIDSVKILSVYQHPNLEEKSYCYRITYKSYEKPLYRKLVIDYHHNVIRNLLEKVLHVKVC